MSERTPDEIRSEIGVERQRLNDDLTALRSEIRSLGLLVVASLVVVALVTWRKGVARRRHGDLEDHQAIRRRLRRVWRG